MRALSQPGWAVVITSLHLPSLISQCAVLTNFDNSNSTVRLQLWDIAGTPSVAHHHVPTTCVQARSASAT